MIKRVAAGYYSHVVDGEARCADGLLPSLTLLDDAHTLDEEQAD